MEVYLTIEELAVMLKISKQSIRRYVLNKIIPFRKIRKAVRFRLSEIEKWIDGGCVDTAVVFYEADEGLPPENADLQDINGGNKEIL